MGQPFTTNILRFETLDSTNTTAIDHARKGAGEGLVIVAREQSAGRGRHQRQWKSPRDAGLYFSILLRPALPRTAWPLVTTVMALSVADALYNECEIVVDLKWPNDIEIESLKLGGILAEALDTVVGAALVVGTGINLREVDGLLTAVPTATVLARHAASIPSADVLLAAILERFAHRYEVLSFADGLQAVVEEASSRSSYASGKLVRVETPEESFTGTTCGLEADGALRVATAGQGVRVIRAGDVTALRALP